MEYFTPNGSMGLSGYSCLKVSGVEDFNMVFLLFIRKNNCRVNQCRMADWGFRGEPLGLIVGVKSIKMPILLKASRKDRICLD